MGCRLGRDANLTDLHEAYQRRGRREDVSAVIGQPSEMCKYWAIREARLGIQPSCDTCLAIPPNPVPT